MIEFRTLGVVDVREVGGSPTRERSLPAVLGQPKRLAVLAYLALHRPVGPVLRDSVLALFWPESPDEQARNALNQSVYGLRQSLGSQIIRTLGADALSERRATWFAEASDRWAPYGGGWYKQWEARIAAALGDGERAVPLLRESYDRGWAHLIDDHRQVDWDDLRGYPPFEELTAVR